MARPSWVGPAVPTGNRMSVQDLPHVELGATPEVDLRDADRPADRDGEGTGERVLPTRRVAFEYPEDTDPMWVPHQPEFAAAANAISLGMPYAEPLFIRAVRSTYDRIDDDLRARSDSYVRQETGHHTQHKRFNDIVSKRYPGTVRVQRMMKANSDWVWRRSPRFRVAYAAAGETISYGVARWTEAHLGDVFEKPDGTVYGDGVNIASRLEGINKTYGTLTCISHDTFREAGDRLCVRPIDDVTVKGRRSKVPIYELVGAYGMGEEFKPDAAAEKLCRMTRAAYEALIAEDFALALERYRAILTEYPDDTVANEMAKRLVATEDTPRVQRQMSR